MTTAQSDPSGRKLGGVFVGGGVAAIVVGAIGLATIGYWYAVDSGRLGNDITLVVSQTPIAFGLLVAAVCVAAGVAMIMIRRDVAVDSPGGVLLLVTVIALSIAVVVGVRAYPQVEQAELVAHGDVSWRTQLPVTEVFGVIDETDDTLTLEGRADRRGCNPVLRSVTIDRDTGSIEDVAELSNVLAPGEEAVSPAPLPLNVEVVQGTTPFICPN